MDLIERIWSVFAVLVLTLTLTMGCAKKAHKEEGGNGGGGVDGGGGDLVYSTKEEVEEAIDRAWRTLIADTPANPLFHAYHELKALKQPTEDDQIVLSIIEKSLEGSKEIPPLASQSKGFEGLNLSYLTEKRLNLKQDDLCSGPGDHRFMASVTKLDRSGEICLSVHRLKSLPTGNLRRDLIALLAHEIAHLNGADEATARKVQRYFIKSMSKLLRDAADIQKARLVSNFMRRAGLAWMGLIPYAEMPRSEIPKNSAQIFVAVADLPVPDPFSGPELNIAHPELFADLSSRRYRVSYRFKAFELMLARNPDREIGAKELRIIRQISLELLDLANDYRYYLVGEGIGTWPREVLLRMTDPTSHLAFTDRIPKFGECKGDFCPTFSPRYFITPLIPPKISREEQQKHFQEHIKQSYQQWIDELEKL